VRVEPAERLRVAGFPADTLVRAALERLAQAADVAPAFVARIDKRIPVVSGLGGGSSDAATALRLANALLPGPLAADELERLAADLGVDVPFFLRSGPQLGSGDGSMLSPLDLPQDYWIALCLPDGVEKASTAAVYARFDERGGEVGFEERRTALLDRLGRIRRPEDLAGLPGNDLASSPLDAELRELGAFRAGVSGAGPAVYGLFLHRRLATAAAAALRRRGRTWVCVPCWYG
jgi:4-diphosphocytidyl-2-C-methyl-D-erythritol kinase